MKIQELHIRSFTTNLIISTKSILTSHNKGCAYTPNTSQTPSRVFTDDFLKRIGPIPTHNPRPKVSSNRPENFLAGGNARMRISFLSGHCSCTVTRHLILMTCRFVRQQPPPCRFPLFAVDFYQALSQSLIFILWTPFMLEVPKFVRDNL